MRCSPCSNSVTIQISSWLFFVWHHSSGLRAPMQCHADPSSLVPSVQSFWEAATYFNRQVKTPILLTCGSCWPWSFSVTWLAGVFYNGLMTSSWFEASSSHRSFQPWYKEQYGPSYLKSKAPFQNFLRFAAVWLYFHRRGNSGSFHTLSISCIPNIHLKSLSSSSLGSLPLSLSAAWDREHLNERAQKLNRPWKKAQSSVLFQLFSSQTGLIC